MKVFINCKILPQTPTIKIPPVSSSEGAPILPYPLSLKAVLTESINLSSN
jgi:hypothetical protein